MSPFFIEPMGILKSGSAIRIVPLPPPNARVASNSYAVEQVPESLNRQVPGCSPMLTGHSYALLESPASGKEMEHEPVSGALAEESAAASAVVLCPGPEQFGADSRDVQISRIAGGGSPKHCTKPHPCAKVHWALYITDLAGRVTTITPGARAD
jgi:hypothetical protein